MDADIKEQKNELGYDGYAELFRNNLKIEIHCIDLAVMQSIFSFADELSRTWVEPRYPFLGSF